MSVWFFSKPEINSFMRLSVCVNMYLVNVCHNFITRTIQVSNISANVPSSKTVTTTPFPVIPLFHTGITCKSNLGNDS